MKNRILYTVLLLICISGLTSCYQKYDESMTYATHSPIPNMLPNMNIEWEGNTNLKDIAIVKATIQNDLQSNVINEVGPKTGKVVVSIQEISDSLGVAGVLWGLIDMYFHTLLGIPFCARHVHVSATIKIWNQDNIIARYSYRGYDKRLLGIYYTKDSQTSIVNATRDVLSDLHRDINKDMHSLTAQLQPLKLQQKQEIRTKDEEEQMHNIPDVDMNIPQSTTKNPNTFVVIYANEDYKRVGKVPFAKQDGKIFAEYCKTTLGIPKKNIHLVENATLNDMRSEIYWLSQVCDAFDGDAKVIVYYSGHGIPDESEKSSYILPVDGDGNRVSSGYKLDDFYKDLGTLSAKMICVFMDACFSGMRKDGEALVPARGVALKAKTGVPQGNMVVFSAAQGDETAYPYVDQQHGLLTYYLLKKLQESAGDVTLQDLGTFITNNVRRKSIVENNKSQTPTVTPSASVADTWQSWKLK